MNWQERRLKFRKECHELYLPYYDALCEELSPEWGPYCVFRSAAEQNRIFALGRSTPANSIFTNARAWESAHQYACASDWCLWDGGDPEWPSKIDKIWDNYTLACEKVGLKCLNFERPHNEIPGFDGKEVREQYETFGLDAAYAFIRNKMKGK